MRSSRPTFKNLLQAVNCHPSCVNFSSNRIERVLYLWTEGNGSWGSKRFDVLLFVFLEALGDRDDWAIRRNPTVHRFLSCLRPVTRQGSNARYRSNSKFRFHQPWNKYHNLDPKGFPSCRLILLFLFLFSTISRRKLRFTIRARCNGKYLDWRTRGEC